MTNHSTHPIDRRPKQLRLVIEDEKIIFHPDFRADLLLIWKGCKEDICDTEKLRENYIEALDIWHDHAEVIGAASWPIKIDAMRKTLALMQEAIVEAKAENSTRRKPRVDGGSAEQQLAEGTPK